MATLIENLQKTVIDQRDLEVRLQALKEDQIFNELLPAELYRMIAELGSKIKLLQSQQEEFETKLIQQESNLLFQNKNIQMLTLKTDELQELIMQQNIKITEQMEKKNEQDALIGLLQSKVSHQSLDMSVMENNLRSRGFII